MKYLISVFAWCLLVSCGEDKYTWEDAYGTISAEFCHFQSECSYLGDKTKEEFRDTCEDHAMYHECEINDLCDYSLAEGAEEAVDKCVEAMHQPEYASACVYAFYGILPAECEDFWAFKPDPDAE
jgi:hypothetical protein